MAVIKYIGKYINAEDAITYFDYLQIESALKNIKDGVEKLEQASKRLRNAENYYSKENLSINRESFENKIEICANHFVSTAKYMDELAEEIKAARLKAYNRKQVELNDEARILDLEKIKQEQIVA